MQITPCPFWFRVVSVAMVIPDYARGNDLYTLGHYEVLPGIPQITLFKGSFDQVYPQADAAEGEAPKAQTLAKDADTEESATRLLAATVTLSAEKATDLKNPAAA